MCKSHCSVSAYLHVRHCFSCWDVLQTDSIPHWVPSFVVARRCVVYILNSRGASGVHSMHLWYNHTGQNSWVPSLCCAVFPEKLSKGEEESVTPPAALSSLQKDLKLKKLVSLTEFKGVQDKSAGKCWCFEQVVVVCLDHKPLLIQLSSVVTLLGEMYLII